MARCAQLQADKEAKRRQACGAGAVAGDDADAKAGAGGDGEDRTGGKQEGVPGGKDGEADVAEARELRAE